VRACALDSISPRRGKERENEKLFGRPCGGGDIFVAALAVSDKDVPRAGLNNRQALPPSERPRRFFSQ
jgi:hypothetical protein